MSNTPMLGAIRASLPRSFGLAAIALVALALAPAPAAAAGPIAVSAANTPGDVDSVYRISAPGSYHLTGNVNAGPGKSGIEIATSNVSLDLGGFTISGNVQSLNGVCIRAANEVEGITVRHGRVTGFGGTGIELYGAAAPQQAVTGLVEDVHVSRNFMHGIRVGNRVVVRGATASNNAAAGISASGTCSIENSTAQGNSNGINVGGGVARGCTAAENAEHGFTTGISAVVVDCVAHENLKNGFYAMNDSVIERCGAYNNGDYGISVGNGSRVADCVARSNKKGGISAGYGSSTVTGNNVLGTISGGGTLPGIRVWGSHAYVADNNVVGADIGIHLDYADGRGNRVEANNLVGNKVGLKVAGSGNIIVRNSARSTSKNYQIVAGNRVGTLATMPASGAIDGNNGGNSGTADAWSNLVY